MIKVEKIKHLLSKDTSCQEIYRTITSNGTISGKNYREAVSFNIDRENFRRAIINTVHNAIQAVEDEESQGNRVRVEAVVVDGRLEVRVSDTGIGIPGDQLENIFEPLFTTKGFGIGLGVPIVKSIMEQHGGDVEFQSEVGKGTTAVLWLPTNKMNQA